MQGWLRPQNDGCALRTIAQLLFGFDLLKAGQRDYVAANIWTGSADKPGVKGKVISINLFYTTLQDVSEEAVGAVLQVPNSLFFQKSVRRWR